MKIKIRKLIQKDLFQHTSLFNKVLTNDFPEYQPKITKIYRDNIFNKKFFSKFIKKKKNCVLGAFDKNGLIGLLVIYGHSGGVAEFIWLMIDKKYREKGLGTTLLKEGEKWTLKNKFHYIFFQTGNQRLVEFYKKRGYEVVGLQKKMYFGISQYLMQKVLRDKPFEEIFKKYLR